MAAFTRILVATDFSDAADAAVRCASVLAWTFGASLAILHVVEDVESRALLGGGSVADGEAWQSVVDDEARLRLDRIVAGVRQERLEPEAVLLAGSPAPAILGCAAERECDLIVVGTHGRKGFGRLLFGSVAEQVVRTARCPVLTLRACHQGTGTREGALHGEKLVKS
jgi:nucleotide-binding universal stress UspA family protein